MIGSKFGEFGGNKAYTLFFSLSWVLFESFACLDCLV